MDSLLPFFDLWSLSSFSFISSISQQATKTPIYCIIIKLVSGLNPSFAESMVSTLIRSMLHDMESGAYIPSSLRVPFPLPFHSKLRALLLLASLEVVDHDSMIRSLSALFQTVEATHNSLMLRMLLINLLYIYPFVTVHETPLTTDEYTSLCDSIHAYIDSAYRASATFQSQSRGFLRVRAAPANEA